MGAKLSKHLLRNQHGTRATLNSSNDPRPSLMIMRMIKPDCLKAKRMNKMKKKRIQEDPADEKKITKVRKLTLEEWLLASPTYRSADQCFGNSSGGEHYVLKQHFSKKVHPSSTSSTTTTTTTTTEVVNEEVVATTSSITQYSSRDACSSFSTDAVSASASFSMDVSSSIMSSRSHQSGKLKKRVSFKLPEEADIILFHSPEEESECDYESS